MGVFIHVIARIYPRVSFFTVQDIVPSLFYDIIEYYFILDRAEQFGREKFDNNGSDSKMAKALSQNIYDK